MPLEKTDFDARYGEGYFHGKGSGYPAEGYEKQHPSWKEWIEFIKLNKGNDVSWLDVGCAYGYLVKEAHECGIRQVFGIDVSTYALNYLPELKEALTQMDAESISFPESSFDVISAFDVLEHLQDPIQALEKFKVTLKPGGWLILSTPDPLYFQRTEPTHFSEHPPSYWVDLLKKLGFSIALRFPGHIYNLEILAINDGQGAFWKAVQPSVGIDYLGALADILDLSDWNDPSVSAVLRSSWSKPVSNGTRYIPEKSFGGIYLLNLSVAPKKVCCRFKFHPKKSDKIYVNLDYAPLWQNEDIRPDDDGTAEVSFEFVLYRGGHLLSMSLLSAVEKISLSLIDIPMEEALAGLSPDQFIRYHFISQAVRQFQRMPAEKFNVLDIGGAPGRLVDFLPDHEVFVLDPKGCDIPESIQGGFGDLPAFPKKFDFVLAIDTLEHIPPDQREHFLEKALALTEQALILAGPFESDSVRNCEASLRRILHDRLGMENEFLNEHHTYGLPHRNIITKFFIERGCSCTAVPLFHLDHWLFLMTAHFAAHASGLSAKSHLTQYNLVFQEFFHAEPSYATALIISAKTTACDKISTWASWLMQKPGMGAHRFLEFQAELLAELVAETRNETLRYGKFLEEQRSRIADLTNQLLSITQTIAEPPFRFTKQIMKNFYKKILKKYARDLEVLTKSSRKN